MEQTVERAVSNVPVRDAVAVQGASPRLVPRGPLADVTLPLLPVRGARELVIGLARQWQSWSGAEVAIVALGLVEVGRKYVARCGEGQLPQLLESTFDRRQADAGFPAFAATDARVLMTEAQPVAVLPFLTGVGAGGVSLYSSEPLELPGELCKQFATLSGRLADQAALVEQRLTDRKLLDAAKANALAEFAAGAGHEINNPLATIAGRIQILLRDEVDGSRRQNLATIGAQALRIRDMIGDLILFGRPPAPRPQRLLLNEAATSVVERFAERARSLSCHLAFSAAGPVIASADATQLQILLSELIRNSLDAIEVSGSVTGEIRVGLERSTTGAKSCAVLSVTDNGPGLSDRDRANLFDPFYSGRHAGRGLGFGLCKCWRIVTEHGGAIEVDSIPQVATTFRVSWPDDCGGMSDTSNSPTSTF